MAFPDVPLLFSRHTRPMVMDRHPRYRILYSQLHRHRLISERRAQGMPQVGGDDLADPLWLSDDGDDVLWSGVLQHDRALRGEPLLRGHGFLEQQAQIAALQVQLEGVGLQTRVIEQLQNQALLTTGALSSRG